MGKAPKALKAPGSEELFQWLVLLAWWGLLYWAQWWEFRPSMDAMTYGALAKKILVTGDWTTLHYADQAYKNFYQHPPLAIWLQALVFKLVGASDVTSKLLPSLFALATVGLVYRWGKAALGSARSSWCGFAAGFILLFSIRYFKYTTGFLLDGPLAFFLTAGAWALVGSSSPVSSLRKGAWVGFCFAAAFLCKGLPALALPALAGVVCLLLLSRREFRALSAAMGAGVGVALLLLFSWYLWGGGAEFLPQYWRQSVQDRLGTGDWVSHLLPVRNVLKVYWPWLPLYFAGLVFLVRDGRKKGHVAWASSGAIAAFGSLIVLGGFVASGNFLEQYLVPFYPFAAVVAARGAGELVSLRWQPRLVRGLAVMAAVAALVIWLLPVHLHREDYRDPLREVLKEAASRCSSGKVCRIHLDGAVVGLWPGLAAGLWYTPWDTRVGPPETASPRCSDDSGRVELLLLDEKSTVPPGWEASGLSRGNFRLLFPFGVGEICR